MNALKKTSETKPTQTKLKAQNRQKNRQRGIFI